MDTSTASSGFFNSLNVMFKNDPWFWGPLLTGVIILIILRFLLQGRWITASRFCLWAALALIVVGGIVGIKQFRDVAPRESDTPAAKTDPVPVVQEGMIEGMNRLADATRQTTIEKSGKKRYKMEWSPRMGYQPVAAIADMGLCAEAMTYSIRVVQADFESDPRQDDLKRALDARFAMVVTGQREHVDGYDSRPPRKVWISNSESLDSAPAVIQIDVPFKATLHFDQVNAWLTGYFHTSSYPHVARLCKEYSEAEGVRWEAWVPGHDTEFADTELMDSWDPSVLPAEMQTLLTALQESGSLPSNLFGGRSEIFAKGCDRTLYSGKGFGHNLCVLMWGPYLESHFGGDTIEAAKVAAFLAANPKARFSSDPSSLDRVQRESREYVTAVANLWFHLGGSEALALGWKQEDYFMPYYQFLTTYTALVLPSNGEIPTWTKGELEKEVRRRGLLPKMPKLLKKLADEGFFDSQG